MKVYAGPGVCQCGCGQQTSRWEQTYRKLGVKKGDYRRYIQGHFQAQKEPAKLATCHPDRPAKARGLCGSCYNAWLINRTEETRGQYLAVQSKRAKARRDQACPQEWADKQRNRVLRHRYGIDSETYDRMFAEQGGCCAICLTAAAGVGRKRLYVDHNHEAGEVRKLLCAACNTAIGVVERGVARVVALGKYLHEHSNDDSTWNSLARLDLLLREAEAAKADR